MLFRSVAGIILFQVRWLLYSSIILRWRCYSISVLVHVIGLHADQFGNNWAKKFLRPAKIEQGRRPGPVWKKVAFRLQNLAPCIVC